MECVRVIDAGLLREVSAPEYGRQDAGYSPGGPLDRFSARTGNILLDNPDFSPVLEIVVPPVLEFEERCLFALTGAGCRDAVLTTASGARGRMREIAHGRVESAERGDRLSRGEKAYGFRTYLCVAACRGAAPAGSGSPLGRDRGAYSELSSWTDPDGRIRVIEGPEFHLLEDAESFVDEPWLTTAEMSDMGIRLAGAGQGPQTVSLGNMISEPVSDGTIQWTPKGPIVLLRGRQTIGGYPRILNVIGPDVDLLAQYGPDQVIRFRRVTVEEAVAVVRTQEQDLDRFRQRFGAARKGRIA
jgi:allophanate hydrolase subunit 2